MEQRILGDNTLEKLLVNIVLDSTLHCILEENTSLRPEYGEGDL